MVNPILIAVRRPCMLRCMDYSGFFRCCAVRAALAPSETRPGGASLRSAAPGRVPSQALSNAPFGQRSLPGRLRTPRTASRARGLRPEKPSADRGAAKATRTRTGIGSLPILLLVWVACASPRKAEGFFGLPARTHQLCEGCGGVGCEKRCQRRVFQGLQRRLNAAEGALGRRRCEPVARHRNTGKTRSSTCGEASTGVAPRSSKGSIGCPVIVLFNKKQARASHRD